MRALLNRRRGFDDEEDGWEERLFNEGAGFDLDDEEDEVEEDPDAEDLEEEDEEPEEDEELDLDDY